MLPIGNLSYIVAELTYSMKTTILLLVVTVGVMLTSFALSFHLDSASAQQNKTLIQPQGLHGMTSNGTNIILVHGGWADASSWGKVITILKNSGNKVIAVNMPLHNLADDVATVKRAIELVGKPVILVGHSYGGEVITNAGYNNPNVTGLVYVAAFAPDEGESLTTFVSPKDFPEGFLMLDSAGLAYINPAMFHDRFAQDVDPTEAYILAVAQKPFNASTFAEKSGPPAWKQHPTWYQISTSDLMIPPDAQQKFAKRMNATTISINASHASYVSHPDEIAKIILDATKGK
jgi:pimeloyl-ACP methyl ester carboxylesterase